MEKLKKYKGIIIGIIIGSVLTGGICGYAAYNYMASDITYTKDGTEMKVSAALNDLYNKSSNYRKPEGTVNITTNGENIDVSQYEKANVSVIPDLEFVDVVKGGKNNTSSASAATVSKQLPAGKYLVITVTTSANGSATTDQNVTDGSYSPEFLSGYSSIENGNRYKYGNYYTTKSSDKWYANQTVYSGIVTMNTSGTLTYTLSHTNGMNVQMIIYKMY